MTKLTVLGLGADAQIYGCSTVSTPEAAEAVSGYILTYAAERPQISYAFSDFVVELLLEGGAELLFELVGGLLSYLLHL